ncbi:MAG: hypothetical protein SNJ29_15340 [Rikenellaceae bacterium]
MRLKSEHTEEVQEINLDDRYSPEIYSLIEEQYKVGNKFFICGIASEEGLTIAFNALKLRKKHRGVHLLTMLYMGHTMKIEKAVSDYFLHNANCIMITSQKYYDNAFSAPNSDLINDFKMTAIKDGLAYSLADIKSISPSFMDLFDDNNEESILNR